MADVVDIDNQFDGLDDSQVDELMLRESEGEDHEWAAWALANGVHEDVVSFVTATPPSEIYAGFVGPASQETIDQVNVAIKANENDPLSWGKIFKMPIHGEKSND